MQLLAPDDYAALELPDQFIERIMQSYEADWIHRNTVKGERILDLGYGDGIVCKTLHAGGRDVTVVDGSSEYQRQAAEAGIRFNLSLFEHFKPPYEYDTVIASFVLEHVADPVALLMRARDWADRLIVVIGNANSYHRQLAVKMGLQPALHTLSERDKKVGHYRVYDLQSITNALAESGWMRVRKKSLMFKPLPNSMMTGFSPELIHAMCQIPVPVECAANIIIECRKF